jgi:hypothetical protein
MESVILVCQFDVSCYFGIFSLEIAAIITITDCALGNVRLQRLKSVSSSKNTVLIFCVLGPVSQMHINISQ